MARSDGRLALFSRAGLAIVGGYAFASAVAVLIAFVPGDRAQNVLGASFTVPAVWVAAAVWSFGVRSSRKAWIAIIGGTALLMALAVLIRGVRA